MKNNLVKMSIISSGIATLLALGGTLTSGYSHELMRGKLLASALFLGLFGVMCVLSAKALKE